MPYTNVVVGRGRTAEEALLFARVNQICNDKKIDNSTISNKVSLIEIPSKIHDLNSSGAIITAIHFANSYHKYITNASNGIEGEFTETEYKYYSILIKKMGREDFNRMMKIYSGGEKETCIAIKDSDQYYKFMY